MFNKIKRFKWIPCLSHKKGFKIKKIKLKR